MRKVKVYIASPYSNGNKEELVQLQLNAAYHLLKLGFNPFAPLYNHFIQINHEDLNGDFPWLELDKEWLKDCDFAIRLHPKDKNDIEILSPGADEEQETCDEYGISMFHFDTLEEMVRMMQTFETTIE